MLTEEIMIHAVREAMFSDTKYVCARNCYVFMSESDLVCYDMNSRRMIEVEIKRNRADLNRDYNKEINVIEGGEPVTMLKHMAISRGLLAHQFYFCFPEGEVSISEMPKHVGAITIRQRQNTEIALPGDHFRGKSILAPVNLIVKEEKPAPLFSEDQPATVASVRAMMKAMNAAMWKRDWNVKMNVEFHR